MGDGTLRPVRLDRPLVARTLLAALILLWPLLIFGTPAYFSDSLSYYKGGRAAVAYVEQALSPTETAFPAGGGSGGGAPVKEAKGARSVLYSVAAYLLAAPGASMTLLAILQALVTAFVLVIFLQHIAFTRLSHSTAISALIGIATPAACFAAFIVPDILAGVLILAMALLGAEPARLSRSIKVALVGIAAFAVTAHASHPPIALGAALAAAIWFAFRRPGDWISSAALLALPLALGVTATLLSGLVGFGTLSVAPKRYPLTLARSIEDGPGRWYLERACRTPRYAVCEVFGTEYPDTVPEFLWGDKGVKDRASPEQMDRIRAEESEIVLAAARAYPDAQLRRMIANIAEQSVRFGLTGLGFGQKVVLDRSGLPVLATTDAQGASVLLIVEKGTLAAVVLSMIALIFLWPSLPPAFRRLVVLIAAGIASNVVVCALFSGVADRYQARVIWTVPLLALALLAARLNAPARASSPAHRQRRGPAQSSPAHRASPG